VLLKDVFEYSLEEIADLVESTVGGVKAALNRGRSKLELLQDWPADSRSTTPENKRILQLYVERFNSRDWDGLRELIAPTPVSSLPIATRAASQPVATWASIRGCK